MSQTPPKSPQEKKALSYAKDRRNAYGENAKASRKAIPARKAGESRRVRRKANQAVDALSQTDDRRADVIESSLTQDIERVGGWTKCPDVPLQDYMKVQARRRGWRGLGPTRTPKSDGEVD